MAMGLKSVVIFFVLVAALVQSSEAQSTHVVLDALGWIIPPAGAVAYRTWAAAQTFAVGDILLFNYANGAHDVAEVTKTAYQDCTKTNTLSTHTTSPTNITLAAGEHYYICTFGNHCSLGQKLAVNVSSTTTSSTTPPPPGTTTASPPPPGGNTTASPPPPSSSATALAAAALPMITLFSIVLAMLH